jgi:galactose-1-phosphate uridylyltransferase
VTTTPGVPPPPAAPLRRMADGTVKQMNPFTGTQVWTVPGRGNRPIDHPPGAVAAVDPGEPEAHCAFCVSRLRETTPEKSRLVRDGDAWTVVDEVAPDDLDRTVPEFRLFGNLFEIVSLDYWKAVHGYRIPARAAAHQSAYLAGEAGVEHVRALVRARIAAAQGDPAGVDSMSTDELAARSQSFFGGCHDVVVARRHLTDGATSTDRHASSGSLTPEEHERFISFTVRAMRGLYGDNPHARYVSVFQNWLRPAGASFAHLHKQLVAIDEIPVKTGRELAALAGEPGRYNTLGVDHAAAEGLVLAANAHAVAVVGVGHRYPSLVVYSRSAASEPWQHSPDELRGVSDLLHACHAATGPLVPTNEEWHTRPPGVDAAMPWRIVLKWRISNPAGFEGATGVYVNTIDPWALRDRVAPRLAELRAAGRIADMALGTECDDVRGSLRYR